MLGSSPSRRRLRSRTFSTAPNAASFDASAFDASFANVSLAKELLSSAVRSVCLLQHQSSHLFLELWENEDLD